MERPARILFVHAKSVLCPAFLVSVFVAGCRGPALEPGFASVDPQERTVALLDSTRRDDRASIPDLIALLDSGDPAERMLAERALRRLTGLDFGYRHYDAPLRRAAAVDAWRRWWTDTGGASLHSARNP